MHMVVINILPALRVDGKAPWNEQLPMLTVVVIAL